MSGARGRSQDKGEEAAFFDKFANVDYDAFDDRGYRAILEEFARLVRPGRGQTAADFGCGTGAFARKLAGFGLEVVGIDISPGCIAQARRGGAGVRFEVGDIEETGLPDNSVDIVVFSGVLHHFTDFSATVGEAYRILRPGGRVFAYDPNRRNPVMWLYRDPRSPVHSKRGRTANERLLERAEIAGVLERAGFHGIDVHGISGVTYAYVESRVGRVLLRLYNVFETFFPRALAGRCGSFLITVAVK